MGLLIYSSILLSSDMNTLLMRLLLTFELIMMLSKYCKVLIFSLMVVLEAMEVYTSLK